MRQSLTVITPWQSIVWDGKRLKCIAMGSYVKKSVDHTMDRAMSLRQMDAAAWSVYKYLEFSFRGYIYSYSYRSRRLTLNIDFPQNESHFIRFC